MARIKHYNSETQSWEYSDVSWGADASVKKGLTVAVIGDSISTHPQKNACEVEIVAEDVGVKLSSYITTYDVDKTISLDGVTSGYKITEDDVGKEIAFVPCAADVGKKLGTPKNYNSIKSVWWQVAADKLGFEPIAATWSGSSITSHTATESGKECSYAWHRHTIRTLGKRIPGSMNRIAPDVVLIYRGTNDLSHSKQVRLTSGYFDKANWNYPASDSLGSGTTYGFKEGLALTVQRIRETYPIARIVLCTCNVFKRSNYSHFPTNNGNFSIPQMNNAIREVADFFGCHVIEFDKCGITWENCYSEGYITDSSTKPTHPNAKGHALLAQQAICDLVNRLHIQDIEPSFDEIEYVPEVEPDEPDTPDTPDEPNIITEGELVDGVYVDKGSGKLISAAQYFTYINIPATAGASYEVPYLRNYAFYDANGAYLSSGGKSGALDAVVTAPNNTATLAVCFRHADRTPTNVTVRVVGEAPSEPDDPSTVTGTLMRNYYIASDTGELKQYTGTGEKYFCYADIPVEGSTTYKAPYARNTAFYDGDGNLISFVGAGGSSGAKITTPEGAVTMTVTYQYKNFESPADVIITKM